MAQPATQAQRLDFLLRYLLGERKEYRNIEIPAAQPEKQRLLRSLMNVRPPAPASEAFLRVQDAYLQEETKRRGTTDVAGLQPVQSGIYLWQGDITTLRCDAIVNAANSQMLGCFVPCHGCIDNAIHTWAGVQLRLACAQQMQRQGREEAPGRAKITPGFNLPCRYVLHTVGPMVGGAVTRKDRELLAGCYRSCLNLAAAHGLQRGLLLHFHRRVPFPRRTGGRDCRSDGAGMAAAEPGERGGDFQCVPRQRLCNLQAPAAMRPCG